jgi:uncharacterized repeat protein (TIGR03806 family)
MTFVGAAMTTAALLTLPCLAAICAAADESGAEKPYGLEKRIAWKSSRVIGRPDPPLPFVAVRAYEKLSLKGPLYLIAEPAVGGQGKPGDAKPEGRGPRMMVVEQAGRIVAFADDPAVESTSVFLKREDCEMYGMTFHPKYAENGFVYVFSNGPGWSKTVKFNRISRFTVRREAPYDCDPASELVIIEWESNGHNGGDLAFGPDGYLYASAGDGTSDSDTNLTGQKISDLVSGMLRIDVERPDKGRGYSVPADNPFLDIPQARPELWAYGFRNPWRIHFDPAGNLWCGDIGQDQYEMVHVVRKGDNYGWSVLEGGEPFYLERERGPHPFARSVIVHPHSEARSITGGVTSLSEKFPELRGAYIYGDYGTGKIWAARYDGKSLSYQKEIADTPYQLLGFAVNHAGEIHFVDYGGGLYRLERAPADAQKTVFPRLLSETGLFASTADHRPDPALIPFTVNSPLWSDGAHKERFIALPEMSQIDFTEEGAWKFPEGAVLVKTFTLDEKAPDRPLRRRIETRLLVIQQNEWVGYTYRWNPEQTDAVLIESAGADAVYTVQDETLGERQQPWRFPSRTECMVCHSRAAGFVLGLTTLQMNKDHDYGGVVDNQLRALAHAGVFKYRVPNSTDNDGKPIYDDGKPARYSDTLSKSPHEYSKLVDPQDEKAALEARVRSYLHANCAQCHVAAGGGNAAMELRWSTSREKAKVIGVRPLHDRFGINEALLVAPGSPERSVLLHRMSKRGRGQMPPLATAHPDPAGIALIRRWIEQLPPVEKEAPP